MISSQYRNPHIPRKTDKALDRSLPNLSKLYDANHKKQFEKFNQDNFWSKVRSMATPRYQSVQKRETSKEILEKRIALKERDFNEEAKELMKSTGFSYQAGAEAGQPSKIRMRHKVIDANDGGILNQVDYEQLVKSRESNRTQSVRIPKIDCQYLMSRFNIKHTEEREKRAKIAAQQIKEQKE